MLESSVNAVDLFCGAGGLTHGMQKAGITVVGGIDFDSDCKFPFEKNNNTAFTHADVSKLSKDDLLGMFDGVEGHRVLAGCAPCQPFSRYARGNRPSNELRWGLLTHFARLALSIRPCIVTMENVPELRHDSIFSDFVGKLRSAGYTVCYSNVFCPDYGIPQHRSRLVLFASRYGPISIESPTCSPEQYATVREAICDLPSLRAGRVDSKDPLHRSSWLSPINMERIRKSKPGGSWRDWPQSLVSKCHRVKSGKTYPGIYGRMEWDAPSPTITTQFFGYGNGRFGHPQQNRALSLREGAILQSFPNDYKFYEEKPMSFAKMGQLIGNAVPVRLGEIIGRSIIRHLENNIS